MGAGRCSAPGLSLSACGRLRPFESAVRCDAAAAPAASALRRSPSPRLCLPRSACASPLCPAHPFESRRRPGAAGSAAPRLRQPPSPCCLTLCGICGCAANLVPSCSPHTTGTPSATAAACQCSVRHPCAAVPCPSPCRTPVERPPRTVAFSGAPSETKLARMSCTGGSRAQSLRSVDSGVDDRGKG